MATPQTPSYALRPCQTWGHDSDSSLTDLTDSEDEEEVQAPQRKKDSRPPPSQDKGTCLASSSSCQGRTTRQATQKATEEDMGAVNDRDQGELPPFTQTPTKVSDAYGEFNALTCVAGCRYSFQNGCVKGWWTSVQIIKEVRDARRQMRGLLLTLQPTDVVWNDAKQMNLIDSIFQNYPVPNLVFRTSSVEAVRSIAEADQDVGLRMAIITGSALTGSKD